MSSRAFSLAAVVKTELIAESNAESKETSSTNHPSHLESKVITTERSSFLSLVSSNVQSHSFNKTSKRSFLSEREK